MRNWTKKHQELCLLKKLPPVACNLWQWLLRREQQAELREIDLRDFQTWVGKRRSQPYHRETIKGGMKNLIDGGIILGRKLGEYWYLWDLRVLDPSKILEADQKNNQGNSTGKVAKPLQSVEDEKELFEQQQQNNTPWSYQPEVIKLLEDNGIPLSKPLLKRHRWRSLEEWTNALTLYWFNGGPEVIGNPLGWLNHCLRQAWWNEVTIFGDWWDVMVKRYGNMMDSEPVKRMEKLMGIYRSPSPYPSFLSSSAVDSSPSADSCPGVDLLLPPVERFPSLDSCPSVEPSASVDQCLSVERSLSASSCSSVDPSPSADQCPSVERSPSVNPFQSNSQSSSVNPFPLTNRFPLTNQPVRVNSFLPVDQSSLTNTFSSIARFLSGDQFFPIKT